MVADEENQSADCILQHRLKSVLAKLVRSSVGFGAPGLEDGVGFVAEKFAHGNAASLMGDLKFAVDEGVVKSCGGGIGGGGSVENARGPSPVDGAEAHGAGFAGGVEVAMIELEGFETLASFADSDDFGVRGGVIGGGDPVGPGGDERAILGDDRGKGSAAVADVFKSEGDGLAHEVEGH